MSHLSLAAQDEVLGMRDLRSVLRKVRIGISAVFHPPHFPRRSGAHTTSVSKASGSQARLMASHQPWAKSPALIIAVDQTNQLSTVLTGLRQMAVSSCPA